MTKNQKEEMLGVFAEGFHDIVVPELEKINGRLNTIEEDLKGVKMTTESLDKKFEAQQNRLDRHGKDIEALKHSFTTL